MKRRIVIAAVAVLAALGSLTANAEFRWNVTAGPTMNTLKFKQDLVEVTNTVGYTGGINGEMMFPGIGFGLDFGLLYNQMGAKVNLGQRKIW